MSAISVEMITALSSGLTTLLGAVAVLLAGRSRRSGVDRRVLKRLVRQLEKKLLAALHHIFKLEQQITRLGGKAIPRPAILETDDEDEDDGGPAPEPARGNSASS